MTRDEARILVLEDALEQAQHTVSFLHGCLTAPATEDRSGYSYAYPDMTLRRLEEWEELVPARPLCVHSMTVKDCESCRSRVEKFARMAEARAVLERSR